MELVTQQVIGGILFFCMFAALVGYTLDFLANDIFYLRPRTLLGIVAVSYILIALIIGFVSLFLKQSQSDSYIGGIFTAGFITVACLLFKIRNEIVLMEVLDPYPIAKKYINVSFQNKWKFWKRNT